VLADYGTGNESDGVHQEPAGEVRPDLRDATGANGILFRKRANPRATAAAGGWASYERGTYCNTLTHNDTGSNLRQKHIVFQNGRLRALTAVEWERLQGFPDDHTAGASDSHRMQALGDAMNVDLATWLGRRLMHVERTLPALPERSNA
jgi:site-specific DNA-cytosine methylase